MAEKGEAKRIYRARTETGEPDPVDTHVGGRLRLRRTLLGMSQTELAKAVGLTFQQVQKYESGANRISASRLYHISEALDVPVSFFFDDMPCQGLGPAQDAAPPLVPQDGGREILDMMRNYRTISDDQVRRGIFDLTKALAARFGGESGE